ncbi:MAG TPA: YraN family protein [Candidatus Saccharimonadales bacterium]|nr:YraN family protein [Candidatus Saccharimonadales bacterium]
MTTFDIGRQAEAAAASFLERKGCFLVAQNWRTRWCEIDIIAQRGQTLYFCEVKYRRSGRQGTGLDYITPKKLRQMHFAAEMWIANAAWQGQCSLCAIEVSGPAFRVTGVAKDVF